MNIFWISGRCGYGKTAFANSIIRNFERGKKKTCKLDCQDFVDILVKNLRDEIPLYDMIHCFQEYDLVVLDDVDLSLWGKPLTQKELKNVILGITENNRTKVILITQRRARKLERLKFDSNKCFYRRLKSPSAELKRNLIKNWLKQDGLVLSEEKIKSIVNGSNNLFQLKGLFNRIRFFEKTNQRIKTMF